MARIGRHRARFRSQLIAGRSVQSLSLATVLGGDVFELLMRPLSRPLHS